MAYQPATPNRISTLNSTSTLLTSSSTFTGTGEDVSKYDSVVVSVKTDQPGTFTVQFSNDNTNWDSTLTRYYRTTQIEAPHRFTITRQYCRITFTNTSASDQTYIRLQTVFGMKSELNAPADSTLAQDFDATVVRPTDYHYEIALGRRQGHTTWNKFGYNEDIDIGTETVWSVGGTFTQLTTARTLSIVSTSTADDGDPAGTGANSVVVYGVDENWDEQIEIVTLNGTSAVTTTGSWFGVNRMAIYLAGSGKANAGKITATATTDLTVQAEMPVGEGTTQHAFFFVPQNHTFLADWLEINAIKTSGGAKPEITVKGWVTSDVSNAKYEVFRDLIDVALISNSAISPSQPFVIGEKSLLEFQITTDTDNTSASIRFSGILVRDVDA